jgi:hypothetical protein
MKQIWLHQRSSGPVVANWKMPARPFELIARHYRHSHTENERGEVENADQQGHGREEADGPPVERPPPSLLL